jgi:hypothetical protein
MHHKQGTSFYGKGLDCKWYKVVNPRIKASQVSWDASKEQSPTACLTMLEQGATVSPSPVTVGGRVIDPISMASKEWKNENTDKRLNDNSDFFEGLTFEDKPSNHQGNQLHPRCVNYLSCPIAHTKHDVLFGQGGDTNFHPGNVCFCEKAKELMPKYLNARKTTRDKCLMVLLKAVLCYLCLTADCDGQT